MADLLRIKRRAVGGATGAPTTLLNAELAFNEVDNVLYYGRGNSAGVATSIIPIAGPGGFLPLAGGTLTGGLSFGAATGASISDISRHLTLHTAGYGLGITGNRLNLVTPTSATTSFVVGGADKLTVANAAITANVPVTLPANPTANLQAAPKQYVDARVRQFNVKLFGATGNGTTDDTAAIQSCITAAGVGNTVYFPAGTYILSATLHGQAGQHFEGDGPNYTTLHRTADYGDTIVFAQAWDVAVRNLFITHSTMYGLSDTSLPNRVTSVSSHLRFANAQGVVVEDCWIWRMPYQITINDGALVKIHRCNIQGCWDPNYVAAQEGIAAIDVGYAAYTQIVTVEHCYFGGSGNGPRPVSWTSADRGTITVNMTAMCGNQYGVRVIQCEDFLFSNNYVGGNVYANFYALLAPGSVNLDWRITGNFIDGTGATGTMIRIFAQADGDFVTAVTIGNNVFNGELQTMSAIAFQNITGGIAPVVNNFAITGNTFSATVGSAMMLYHCRGGVIRATR